MTLKKIKNNKGFVILFTVILVGILLAIALDVENVTLKEIQFGTSARDTNNAFFAADTGIECALFYDKSASASNAFTGSATMNCAGSPITITASGTPASFWSFVVPALGGLGQSCAKVTVDKTIPTATTIISDGYNIGDNLCASTNPNRVERELKTSY